MSTLETSLQKRARMMSGRYDLTLICEGSQAYATWSHPEPPKIVLPALPNKLDTEVLLDIDGYLEHEEGHIDHTDFRFINRKGFAGEIHKNMWNACEDSWMELEHIKKFPGAKTILDRLNTKWKGIHAANWKKIPAAFRLITNIRNIMEDEDLRLDADIAPAFTARVRALALTLRIATSTKEIHAITLEICNEMVKALQQAKDNQPQPASQQDTDEANTDEGKTGEQDDGQQNDTGDDGEGNAEDQTDDSEDAAGDGQDIGAAAGSLDPKELEKPEHYETDIPTDIHTYINKILGKIQEQAAEENEKVFREVRLDNEIATSGKHIAASTRFDELINYTRERPTAAYQQISQKIKSMATRVAEDIDEMLTIEEQQRWLYDQESGKVNRKAFIKCATDKSYSTPFKVLKKNTLRDVDLMLAVDLSASMRGDKLELAKASTALFAEALSSLGMNFEIGGFNTGGKSIESIAPGANRRENLRHTVFKSFDTDNLQSIALMQAQSANADGESLRFFGERLLQGSGERKIMFVFSDGMPSAACKNHALLNKDLKDAVDELTAAGIEVIAFGILTDSVSLFYPQHVIVEDIASLPKVVATHLKKILTKV